MKSAELVKTLILAGIFLALTLPRSVYIAFFGSFVFVAAMLVFVPWTIYSLVRMAIRPAERRSRGIRLAVAATALVVAFVAREDWDTTAREEANTAVSAVKAYNGRTGGYPSSLSDVAIDAQALKEQFSLSYRVQDGKAYLFYSQPSMPMVAHHYNFGTNSWDRLD